MLDVGLGEFKNGPPFSVAALSKNFYKNVNYSQFAPQAFKRIPDSVYAAMATNEVLDPKNLHIPNKWINEKGRLDGYIVGVGSSSIWAMMEFFNISNNSQGNLPKGIVAIDIDPATILTGHLIVDYAKEGGSINKLIEDFFQAEHIQQDIEDDPVIKRAKRIVESYKVANPDFAASLEGSLPDLKKDLDKYARIWRNTNFLIKRYSDEFPEVDSFSKIDLVKTFFRNWDKITELAKEDRIAFIHTDIKNEEALKYISQQLPDMATSSNMIYVSNVLDHLKRNNIPQEQINFKELKRILDPNNRSYYAYSEQRGSYHLEIGEFPPPWNYDYVKEEMT